MTNRVGRETYKFRWNHRMKRSSKLRKWKYGFIGWRYVYWKYQILWVVWDEWNIWEFFCLWDVEYHSFLCVGKSKWTNWTTRSWKNRWKYKRIRRNLSIDYLEKSTAWFYYVRLPRKWISQLIPQIYLNRSQAVIEEIFSIAFL